MKRKLVFGFLALSAASMLCGFDSTETAESVLEKMSESTASIESMSSELDMNFDIFVAIGDGSTTTTIQVLMTTDLDIAATLDPLATKIEGTVGLSALGTEETISMKVYTLTEGDDLNTYIYTEDSSYDEEGEGTWQYGSASDLDLDIDIESLLDTSSSINYSDMEEWGVVFELSPEAADYDGAECYLLSAVVDSSSLLTMIDKAEELAGAEFSDEMELDDETMDLIYEMMDGLNIRIEYYVDSTTFLPVGVHIDLNDTDLSAINDYASELLASYFDDEDSDTTTTIEIILNDTSIDYSISYEDVGEITVPQEALDAIASGEAQSLDDYYDDYGDDYYDDFDDSYESEEINEI
ncbi:MAG: hypothetical protein LUF35_09885 [Lachnospiraceae bacterium]|nr:hypothetical protein [Lachnospiraceae bacterium]